MTQRAFTAIWVIFLLLNELAAIVGFGCLEFFLFRFPFCEFSLSFFALIVCHDVGKESASEVLSIVFRKNASAKMKICAGKPGEGAAKAHLVALQHLCYFSVAHANSSVVRYFIHRYRFDPHSFPDTYRNLAQTSISADLPSGKVPTTRVRLRWPHGNPPHPR